MDAGVSGEAHASADRLAFVPQAIWAPALAQPVTRRLLVTGVGHFPTARHHRCHRPHGIAEAVLIVCTAGSGWLELGDATHRIARGQAALLAPGQGHSYGAAESDPWTIWWCHLRGTDVADALAVAGATRTRPVLGLRAPERVVGCLDEMLTTLRRDHTPAGLLASSGVAWRLFSQLGVERISPEVGDPLQRAMAHLSERHAAHVTVPDLARLVGLSPSHLTTLFRAATGGGVLAFQTTVRMSRAREMLDGTDLSIAQIAQRVGYDDAFYFSRRFKRLHHLTPTQYRERTKG